MQDSIFDTSIFDSVQSVDLDVPLRPVFHSPQQAAQTGGRDDNPTRAPGGIAEQPVVHATETPVVPNRAPLTAALVITAWQAVLDEFSVDSFTTELCRLLGAKAEIARLGVILIVFEEGATEGFAVPDPVETIDRLGQFFSSDSPRMSRPSRIDLPARMRRGNAGWALDGAPGRVAG